MQYPVVATDFDGTLAEEGRVSQETRAAIVRVRKSGRRVILITGRELDNLQEVFPTLDLFDVVVAENGALVYDPVTHAEKFLGPPLPSRFIKELQRDGVRPLSIGRRIVATLRPHETKVYQLIRELHLSLQVIFNRESVMVLSAGMDKAAGLKAVLTEFGVSSDHVLGFGDAENDYAFLGLCGFSVAVANAIPSLKERVDLVTAGSCGNGVVEVLNQLLTLGTLP